MEVGQEIEIHEDPITKWRLEGTARVVTIYKSETIWLDGEEHTEYHLDVKFTDEEPGDRDVYFRRYVD